MDIRRSVRQFPGPALALILALVAALAAVMTLAVGGWGLTFTTSGTTGRPTTQGETQPGIQLQQPAVTPQPCEGSRSDCSS